MLLYWHVDKPSQLVGLSTLVLLVDDMKLSWQQYLVIGEITYRGIAYSICTLYRDYILGLSQHKCHDMDVSIGKDHPNYI